MQGALRSFGLDLAWGDRRRSGACVVDAGGRILDEQMLAGDDEVIGWVALHLSGPAVVAADIPLLVPNTDGMRACEKELRSVYGARHAGPHSSNRKLFTQRYGRVRGEDLAGRLAGLGFTDPWAGGRRTLLEVYPHPALIEVFGLDRRHAYKKGTVSERRRGLARLATMLRSLEDADPPLSGPPVEVGDAERGAALKALEDRLDARFCAWIALAWHRRGRRRFRVFGAPGEGHIAVPLG